MLASHAYTPISHSINLPESAESRFRSFETGDYSNEIMGLASAAGFFAGLAGAKPGEPERSGTEQNGASPSVIARPKLQILTIPRMLLRVRFTMPPV